MPSKTITLTRAVEVLGQTFPAGTVFRPKRKYGQNGWAYFLPGWSEEEGGYGWTSDSKGQLAALKNPRRIRRRRNSIGMDAMFYALQSKRIPWSLFSTAQIREVMADAAAHGDTALYNRAKAALARR